MRFSNAFQKTHRAEHSRVECNDSQCNKPIRTRRQNVDAVFERGKLKRLQPEVSAGKEKIATGRESGKMTSAKLRDVFSHVPDWRKIQRLCCDWFTVNCLRDGHRRDRPQVFV